MKLIVGLCNPGSVYASTRHNVGAWFLDEAAKTYSLSWKHDKTLQVYWGRYETAGQVVFLAKNTTFMNESGRAVGAFAKFYRILPSEILLVHDELDLPPGVVRLKKGGGHGGHNGLRDVIAHLGSPDFYRLRFGIGHPGDRDQVANYVLGIPGKQEQEDIHQAIQTGIKMLPDLIQGHEAKVMQFLHTER